MDPTQPATVLNDIAAEIEIPQDGTLSRVLHSDDQVRLVAFGFDTGQELTDHTAGVPVVLQVVSGRLEISLDGDISEIGHRSWVHMPAHLPHAVKALEPTIMILTLLKSGK